jgi:hypothetical protein
MIRFWGCLAAMALLCSATAVAPQPAASAAKGTNMETKPATDQKGPLLTDQQLFGALNLSLPALAGVKTAVDAGNLAQAKALLAGYLRQRTTVPWWFDPHKEDRSIQFNKQAADNAVAGKVRVVTIWHTFPNGEIDWLYNPTYVEPGMPHNAEWQWQLGRMSFWHDLGAAYWATGDETYARAFARQLEGWVHNCPCPADSGNYVFSAWRTIECGIRMSGSWPEAYHRFLLSPSFTDDDICLYLESCIEQARHLRKFPTTGNWLTMEMSGLYTVGAVFPELKEAQDWRSYATNRLHEELTRQFLPDGAQYELSTGYHQVALENTLLIPRLARQVGRMSEIPADYVKDAEKAFDYNLYMMAPDRSMPKFNDSWNVNVPASLARAAVLFPDRTDYTWIATDGKEGHPPTQTSFPFPWAGYFTMRSGWDRQACYLCFDDGPLGKGHYHQDKLSVVVWPYGREMLFDSGGGTYEQSKWRAYSISTFAHNTVLVDGKPQERSPKDPKDLVSATPIDVHWESDAAHDFASGEYDEGYGTPENRPATHRRSVLFVKPDLFIVADTLTPHDAAPHIYQARWHLLTTKTTEDPATMAVSSQDDGKANLAVVPLFTAGLDVRHASAQTEPELLGWWIGHETDPQYVPATTVLHTIRGAGVQHFLTLLNPLHPGQSCPVKEVKDEGAGTASVTLNDGRRYRITAGDDGSIRFEETLAGCKIGRQIRS